jgi:polysaccharide pyruvyl transferase WcaK-like protein
MTTDFVVTVGNMTQNTIVARTIKYENKLASQRVMQKFEIERVYWTSRDVDWGIVTERNISREFAGNVQWLHSHRDLASLAPATEETVRKVEEYLAPKTFFQFNAAPNAD